MIGGEEMDKRRILIIDDEEDFCGIVKKNLERSGGFLVEIAANGKDGIELAKKIKPDLILVDVIMPEMEGGEVVSRIKDDTDTKEIPIVFLTAAVTKEEADSQKGFIGGYPFIAKTVPVEELIAGINENIHSGRS